MAGGSDTEKTETLHTEKLGWRALVSDVWFFPALFFTMFGGSLPIISVMNAVGVRHNFEAPIRAIIDAYYEGTATFGVIAEPYLMPFVRWLGELFGWHLQLYPHWRHLLVMALIVPLSSIRSTMQASGFKGLWLDGFALPLGFLGALLTGLVNPNGNWLFQGLIAGIPSFFMWLGLFVIRIFMTSARVRWIFVKVVLLRTLLPFGVAVVLSLFSPTHTYAGFLGLGVSIIWFGWTMVQNAVWYKGNEHYASNDQLRYGLAVLSSFIGTGFVFLLDWVLKTYLRIA